MRNADFRPEHGGKGMEKHLPIGIFDSGIGGLTVAAAIARELPQERIFYFGDIARCPYGNRSNEEVLEFSIQIMNYLVGLGIKLAVVACNTATAVALPELQRRFGIPVIGVIEPGSRAATRGSTTGKIGVIGTNVTVNSGAYDREIRKLTKEVSVYSLACPKFVPLVEQGCWNGPVVEKTVSESLQPLIISGIDTLILGCTHYPLLQSAIAQIMGPGVRLISSADETAKEVRTMLQHQDALSPARQGENQYFTTGDGSKMKQVLLDWMGVVNSEERIVTVHLDALASY